VRLGGARLYLVAGAATTAGPLAELIPDLATAGVDIVQLRAKDAEARDILRAGEPIAAACARASIPFIVNDRPDIALALGADGVHLGQNDLPVAVARRILGTSIVGRSTHTPSEVDDVVAAGDADYFALGPVYETPTKAGRPAVGLDLVRYAAALETVLPWFAIGGIDEDNVDDVVEAGARRIVVVRAITDSPDPVAAARRLRARLDAAPL
jgi:thiamine-phosphate pyrophosphorylase